VLFETFGSEKLGERTDVGGKGKTLMQAKTMVVVGKKKKKTFKGEVMGERIGRRNSGQGHGRTVKPFNFVKI